MTRVPIFLTAEGILGPQACVLCTNVILSSHIYSVPCIPSALISSLQVSLQSASDPFWRELKPRHAFLHLLVSASSPPHGTRLLAPGPRMFFGLERRLTWEMIQVCKFQERRERDTGS